MDGVPCISQFRNLNKLALIYGTDKWGSHWYTQHYQRYFAGWRKRPLKVLEIRVGGYENLSDGAQSLRMWKRYFLNSKVVGIDLYDKSHLCESRIDVLQCDQTDAKRLTEISQSYDGFDIIIDDGSHLNEHVIQTFKILFPLLRTPGFYCIEDLQTAYWPDWGAVCGTTSMDMLCSLTDCVNQAERPCYEPTCFDKNITEIAFFHNLCIIRKEPNKEATNAPKELDKNCKQLSGPGAC
jgi:demethylmacrocin O-methyltransferase